jgi:hypothetical protein
VSLNSSKSYTYTAGDRLFINRIYLSLTDIQEEKKKKAFLVDMKRLDIAVFSKEYFSFVHQFLTRVHITTVWIMTMIVRVSQRQWHQLNSSHAHTWRDGTIQMMANILLHLSPPLSLSPLSIRRDDAAAAVHIHLIRVDVHIYINVIWTNQWAHILPTERNRSTDDARLKVSKDIFHNLIIDLLFY